MLNIVGIYFMLPLAMPGLKHFFPHHEYTVDINTEISILDN